MTGPEIARAIAEIRTRAFRQVLAAVNEMQPDYPVTASRLSFQFGHRQAREQIYAAVETMIEGEK